MKAFTLYKEYKELRKNYPGKSISKKEFKKYEGALKTAAKLRFKERYAQLAVKLDGHLSYMITIDSESVVPQIVNNAFVDALKGYNKRK